ncbi:cyclase family protein [Chloroflexota bacterium]
MSRIIDLTATIGDPRLPVIPFFPQVTLEPIHIHEVHGRSNTKLSMPIHVGTHVDAPYHFVPEGVAVDELPLEKVMGKAVRLDLRKLAKENTAITVEDVRSVVASRKIDLRGKIVVLQTGWAERAFFSLNFYTDNPFLAEETSHWLVTQAIKALALDHPIESGIKLGSPPPTLGDSPNHRYFLGNGIPFIENVVNLETFDDLEFGIIAMPLKIFHGDGGPARVIAITGDWSLDFP